MAAPNPDRILPRDVPDRLKCYLIGAGVRGRLCNLSELVGILGQKRLSAFETPEDGWRAAEGEAAALARLLDQAGPACEVPERVLSGTPAPAPPDERIVLLLNAVRDRNREQLRTSLAQFDAWYELMSEEATNPEAAARTA
jgi:hypothetical protein